MKIAPEPYWDATPDKRLPPKRKYFEQCLPYLNSGDSKFARYKEQPFTIAQNGLLIVSDTLKNYTIG
jgi:hypothetical protein